MSIFEALRGLDDHDEPRSLRFSTTGLPLWPFVRWLAFSAAQDQALGLQAAFAETSRTIRQTAELLMRSQLRGPLSAGRSFEVVIVGSGSGIVLQREGRWFDRINDYFAAEHDSTLVLDMARHAGYKSPRFPPHVRCYDTFDIRAGLQARVRRPSSADLAAIDRLLGFVRARFPVSLGAATLDQIRASLVYWSVRLPILREAWSRFFARTRPRVLFVEDGSYGAFSHVLAWARNAGIATAEFQHGLIARSHLAYNFGDAHAFADCLPNHLLLYGELWRGEVRTPSEPTVVGCPHFSETARPPSPSTNVVIISQGIRTEAMVRLAEVVARAFPHRAVVFRLHPGEVPFRERYAQLARLPNIEISDRGDLYAQLQGVVIGHSSTALVEAAGIGLSVLVLDDATSRALLPHTLGTWFSTADELVALVESPPAAAANPDQFFASGWRERYRSFLGRLGAA